MSLGCLIALFILGLVFLIKVVMEDEWRKFP